MKNWMLILAIFAMSSLAFTGCAKKKPASLTEQGKVLYTTKGCATCHSVNGAKMIGPTFKGLYGKKEIVVTDGKEREITVDDAFIIKSINDPDGDVTKGFSKGQMILTPAQKPNAEEIKALIAYIKTLK